ncbi:hypothetical protein QTP88_022031 [Uroleucon formosanum]
MTTTTAADLAPVTLPTEIASIAHVRLPSFWRHAPRQWFTHADAIFHTSRVRSDLSRVNHVLASLDDEGIRTVSDLLGVDASYSLMRERLISSYTAPHSARFQSIVQPGGMGDRTSSRLLRDMREVYPEGMPDATLEQFWLAKLPTAVRTVIAGFSGPLDTLAERADRIFEAFMNNFIITSGSGTIIVYNDESGSSSFQSVQLLEDQRQTKNEQQSSKSIKMASTATILDGTFFKLISSDSKNVIASCVKCQPKNVNIKGSKFSSSNFKSHLKRKHDSSILDEYEKYINDTRKKEKIEYPNNTNCKNKTKYSQNQFDEDVTNYIIHSMAPLSTVENPFFKEMFIASGILKNNSLTLMSRRSLS